MDSTPSPAEFDGAVRTLQADATDASTVRRLLHEYKPQLVVLAAGVRPQMGTLDEFSWETFSIPWNADTQAAFHLLKAALTVPLAPGSTVAIVSSGAAVAGSPLSGGYAGAKRMQWFMAEYAQEVSDAKKLGISFFAVLPRQLIEGTEIGNDRSRQLRSGARVICGGVFQASLEGAARRR